MRTKKYIWLLAVFMLGLAVFVGCSDDDDDDPVAPVNNHDAQETIGAAGGSIGITDEFSLAIPAAALDADVDFTVDDAGTDHADMLETRVLASAVFTVGPAGTTFNSPVALTLHYAEDDLGGEDESSIVIYTDSGTGWTELATTVDEVANTASAQITHLSDFAVTVPVESTGETIVDQTYSSTVPLVIPDATSGSYGTPALSVLSVMASGTVDSVRVYVNITHDYPSDLTIKLTSPDGTQLRVFWIGEGGEPETNPVGWYPDDFTPKDDLNGFDGESVSGDWILTAQDMSYGDAGTLNEWRLHVFYAE